MDPEFFARQKQPAVALSNYVNHLHSLDLNQVTVWQQTLDVEPDGWYISAEVDDVNWRELPQRELLLAWLKRTTEQIKQRSSPWPEEGNRRLTGVLSQLHFAPTVQAKNHLLQEHVPSETIAVTGNTVIDALFLAIEKLKKPEIKAEMEHMFPFLENSSRMVLITAHRRENHGEPMEAIAMAIKQLAFHYPDSIFVLPLYPNPKVKVPLSAHLAAINNVHLIEPQEYLPFVYLMMRATLILIYLLKECYMKKTLKLTTLSCALLYSSLGLTFESRSLEDSVEKAVLSNPEIGAQFQDFQSSLEGKKVARGALLPEINASARAGREWEGGTNWTRRGYTLELRQLLFDGFASLNEVKLLGLEKLSDYYELLATVDNVALEAALAHIDVLRYREMEGLAEENYQMHVSTLRQIEERQMSGIGRGVDLEQAYGREALAQSNLMVESGNLNDVLQRYQRIVGEPASASLLPAPSVAADLPVDNLNFNDSLRKNPSLLSKQALVQAADKGRSIARGRLSPTVHLKAATGRDRNPNPNNPSYRDAQASNVQIEATYNLYRGGADSARIRQTAAQEYAARDVRDYTCRNMQQELNIAWNTIERIRAQIPFLEAHEMATSRVRVAYMQQFQIGERSLLDVLDTENELFDARRAIASARYDLQQAELRWLTFSHRVLSALGLADPYADEVPEEMAQLDLSDEVIELCSKPVPNTSNLKPVSVKYNEGMNPPLLVEVE